MAMDILQRFWSGYLRAQEWIPWDTYTADQTEAIKVFDRGEDLFERDLFEKGDFSGALAAFTQAISLWQNPEFYRERGMVYICMKDSEMALKDYTKAIKLNPAVSVYYFSRGLAYLDAARYDKAIADFTKTIEMDDTIPLHYGKRARAYFLKGEFDKAAADYAEALMLDPTAFHREGNEKLKQEQAEVQAKIRETGGKNIRITVKKREGDSVHDMELYGLIDALNGDSGQDFSVAAPSVPSAPSRKKGNKK
jgi:tetratricopeptide (TPR) repeat protein